MLITADIQAKLAEVMRERLAHEAEERERRAAQGITDKRAIRCKDCGALGQIHGHHFAGYTHGSEKLTIELCPQAFNAIQAFYLSNRPRDRQIADRMTSLYRDALAEDEHILPASLDQFTQFFLNHPDLGFPRITLTPDGTLRARWIHGPENFVAIEFTGEPNVKLIAEIPGAVPSIHVSTEPLTDKVSSALASNRQA